MIGAHLLNKGRSLIGLSGVWLQISIILLTEKTTNCDFHNQSVHQPGENKWCPLEHVKTAHSISNLIRNVISKGLNYSD